jgi:hypothetical protein
MNAQQAIDDVVELKRRIIEAAERVIAAGSLGPEDSEFHRARYDLYAIAGADLSSKAVHALAADPGIRALSREIFPICCLAGIREECQIAAQLLREPSLTFGKIYRTYHGHIYESLMGDELAWLEQAGNLSSQAHGPLVAYIGGGALPIPAMLLAQRMAWRGGGALRG